MTSAAQNATAKPLATPHPEATGEENPLLQEYAYPSMFGSAEVFALETEDGTPVRVLYVGGGFQSATYLEDRRFEPVFAYYRALDALFQTEPDLPQNRVLLIGGGGFSYPKHLLTTRKGTAIDVAEIDPAIIQIARNHFFLDQIEAQHGPAGTNRLRSFAADGLAFLQDAPDQAYSTIINDSFDGTAPTAHLLSDQALTQARRCLVPGGLYMLNLVVDEDPDNTEALTAASQTLEQVRSALTGAFAHAFEQVCVDEEFGGADNHLFIATDGAYEFVDFAPVSARA